MFKKSIILPFLFLIVGCKKQEDCMTIRQKVSSNGTFYFLNRTGDDLVNENIIVKQLSVTADIFNQFSVGDQYCRE